MIITSKEYLQWLLVYLCSVPGTEQKFDIMTLEGQSYPKFMLCGSKVYCIISRDEKIGSVYGGIYPHTIAR